ncbi:unnamed protein product [Lactuca saligna]|uniref:Uncharacterized protein n=1 Tax=Lactuca saligna TaxID=75948 RepID=A0AA35YYD1_LACSI|nr:unnamed protein product [Lactuca saligna]
MAINDPEHKEEEEAAAADDEDTGAQVTPIDKLKAVEHLRSSTIMAINDPEHKEGEESAADDEDTRAQVVDGVSKVKDGYNPATWMLEVSTSAQELTLGGDISYEQFLTDSKGILESLRKRAHMMTDEFNSCKTVVCNFIEGAMYSFPQIKLPPKAIEAATSAGKVLDVFYCLKLLEAIGISTVPGLGFGQKEG